MYPLIDHDELAERIHHVLIFDLRWSLTDPARGRQAYEEGHIPGAVFVDLDADLSAPPGISGRHPLPPVDAFGKTLGRLGITPNAEVVAYDDMSGAIASRLWWMLRSIGHEASRVLDGGFQAWVDAGHPVETEWMEPEPKDYPVPRSFQGVMDVDEVPHHEVVDARAPERYTGETEPIDPKAGHIPGAVNLPYSGNLDCQGRFLSKDRLEERFRQVPDRAAMSCGSGVTACHNALAMVLAGRKLPRVYIGSFSEWSRRDMPVKTGPRP
jgi:thiosulfate/3-mercaptopyruvate sulfurtransferase